jgi:ABC-2 type transport system ATP-binding protein
VTEWGLSQVTVAFGSTVALSDVTMSVAPGTVTAIVGGDGAGKSTLLRVLVGVLAPQTGTVTKPPRANIGFLAGQNAVYDDLTVSENLDFVARAYRLSGVEYQTRLTDLLERTALDGVTSRLGAQLSGGMRQKLGVAMALLSQPQLVVLDEPTTGVDPVSRIELSRLISHAASQGAAVVLSTTYMSEATRADEVLVLDGGRALLVGTPASIVASLPGVVCSAQQRPTDTVAWRRESTWHFWASDGIVPTDALSVTPDLEDAVLVASLHNAQSAGIA